MVKYLDVGKATRQIHESPTFFYLLNDKYTILYYTYGGKILFEHNI